MNAMDDSKMMKPAFIDRYVQYIENAKAYTIDVAQAMPADKYSWKPHPEAPRTFAGQMQHIAGGLQFQLGLIKSKGVPPEDFNPGAVQPDMEKEQILTMLEESFNMYKEAVKNASVEHLDEKLTLAFIPDYEFDMYGYYEFMRDHVTHHRGQAVIYLRANGIKPPQYRGF
jgi:uncharacterized damage-inducible protein DinB